MVSQGFTLAAAAIMGLTLALRPDRGATQPTWRTGGPARNAPSVVMTPIGPPEIAFNRKTDACDGHDVPDAPARAFRDRDGQVVLFGMHHVNRALRGATLDKVAPVSSARKRPAIP